jgi:predicted transcriptional regulator
MFNIDKSKLIIGEAIFNFVCNANKETLLKMQSDINTDITFLENNAAKHIKDEILPKRLIEKQLIEYRLEESEKCTELSIKEMEARLRIGAISETNRGEENVYFVNEFGERFFCKCL